MENLEEVVLRKIDDMREEIIQFLQQLVKFPSEIPPGKYRQISKHIAAKMEEIGLKTQIKRNNVISELGEGDGPSLIFNAHFDTTTVHDGWTKDAHSGEMIDNKIYGRGSSDDKSSVVAEIFATKALIDAGIDLKGKLIVTAVVNEEIGGLGGTEFLVNENIVKGDACLLGDAPVDYPTAYRGGALQFSFAIKGIRRHAMAYPDVMLKYRNEYSGINAIHKMVPIINFLMELQQEFNKKETKYPVPPDLPKKISSIEITKLEGGNAIDTVADSCNLHCIINVIPEQDIESVRKKIFNFIENLKKDDPKLEITVQNPVSIPPIVANIDSNIAIAVKKAFKKLHNEEREFKTFIPTTDAHNFQLKGMETILIGTLRGDNNYHAQDEFVYIEDVINTTKIFALTALNYLK
jgi:acetylornithine deacetylase/succinyl-diaminopimelate desuccinylase-like protein